MATYSDDAGIIDLEALLDEARSSGELRSEQGHFVSPLEIPPPATWVQLMTSPSEPPQAPTIPPAQGSAPALASSIVPPRKPAARGGRTGLVIGATLTVAALAGGLLLLERARQELTVVEAPKAAFVQTARHADVAFAPVRPAPDARVAHAPEAAGAGHGASKRTRKHHATPSSETARQAPPEPVADVAPEPAIEPAAPEPVAELAPEPTGVILAADAGAAPAVAGEESAEAATTIATLAPAPAADHDLASAMRSAVEAPGERVRVEAPVPRESPRQLRPSAGALTSAIRAVMPKARACLGSDSSTRTGRVVFQADGSVTRVDLDGSSAEDECIRAALASAKIDPFVEAPFTMKVAVRR